MAPLSYRKMEFEEFCAAAISTYQLEALDGWEQIASTAFEHFELEGNRVISVEELARVLSVFPYFLAPQNLSFCCVYFCLGVVKKFSTCGTLMQELNLGPTAYSILKDWIRNDGKLSLLGYTKFLHGVTLRSSNTRHH